MLVLGLSYLHLSGVRHCPLNVRTGAPLSQHQYAMVARLMRLVQEWFRPPYPFGGRGLLKAQCMMNYFNDVSLQGTGASVPPPATMVASAFDASRARFAADPSLSVDATKLLPIFEAATFVEPSLLELGRDRTTPIPNPPNRADAEVLKYVRSWDAGDKLELALPDEVSDRFQHIAVPKDAHKDRVVSDRRRRNAREFHLRGASSHMPSGPLLCEYELQDGQELRVYSDDLADMFPSFPVPWERALTNAVALRCCASDFKGTAALKRLEQRLRRNGEQLHPDQRVVALNASMVMGDINAVDYCMGAHEAALAPSRTAHPECTHVRGRSPFPIGPHAEAIVVDDRVGLGAVTCGKRAGPPELEASFSDGADALRQTGFGVHPDKAIRNSSHAAPLGIEIRGDSGLAGAERARRHALARLSLEIARLGRWTGALRRRLVSSWAFALECRRPMLCVMDQLYKGQCPLDEDNLVADLTNAERTELLLLAVLAPLMVADLRMPHSRRLRCSDASLRGIAGCSTEAPPPGCMRSFGVIASGVATIPACRVAP